MPHRSNTGPVYITFSASIHLQLIADKDIGLAISPLAQETRACHPHFGTADDGAHGGADTRQHGTSGGIDAVTACKHCQEERKHSKEICYRYKRRSAARPVRAAVRARFAPWFAPCCPLGERDTIDTLSYSFDFTSYGDKFFIILCFINL